MATIGEICKREVVVTTGSASVAAAAQLTLAGIAVRELSHEAAAHDAYYA